MFWKKHAPSFERGFFLGKIGAEMFDIFRTVFPDSYREGEVLKKHAPSFERVVFFYTFRCEYYAMFQPPIFLVVTIVVEFNKNIRRFLRRSLFCKFSVRKIVYFSLPNITIFAAVDTFENNDHVIFGKNNIGAVNFIVYVFEEFSRRDDSIFVKWSARGFWKEVVKYYAKFTASIILKNNDVDIFRKKITGADN